MGSWHGKHRLMVTRPSHGTTQLCNPRCATPKKGKDGKELKLKVAEHEHQFKVVDEAQKTLYGEGNDTEGHQTRVLDGTDKVR